MFLSAHPITTSPGCPWGGRGGDFLLNNFLISIAPFIPREVRISSQMEHNYMQATQRDCFIHYKKAATAGQKGSHCLRVCDTVLQTVWGRKGRMPLSTEKAGEIKKVKLN